MPFAGQLFSSWQVIGKRYRDMYFINIGRKKPRNVIESQIVYRACTGKSRKNPCNPHSCTLPWLR